MEAPAVRRDDPLLRPLQGLAQDRGPAGEDEDARAQERQSGHALLGVVHLRHPDPGIRAGLLPPLLTELFYEPSVCVPWINHLDVFYQCERTASFLVDRDRDTESVGVRGECFFC